MALCHPEQCFLSPECVCVCFVSGSFCAPLANLNRSKLLELRVADGSEHHSGTSYTRVTAGNKPPARPAFAQKLEPSHWSAAKWLCADWCLSFGCCGVLSLLAKRGFFVLTHSTFRTRSLDFGYDISSGLLLFVRDSFPYKT